VGIDLRPVDSDEFADFISVTFAAFGNVPTPEQLEDDLSIGDLDRSLAAVEAGRFVGAAGAYAFDLTLPGGTTTPVAGVTWVGVLPTHRRKGILRSIMARQLDDVAERGESVAILTASEAVIYGRFGYGVATHFTEVELDPYRADLSPLASESGRVRLLSPDEARKIVPAVYDAYRLTRPGEVTRHERWWDLTFRDREKWRRGASANFYAIHESASGEPDAYVRYRVKETWDQTVRGNRLIIVEAVGTSPEAEAPLWRYLFEIDLIHTAQAFMRPLDDWLRWRLVDPRSYRITELDDFVWVRLVDVGAALEARRYAVDGSVTFAVDDPFRPANSGTWVLEGGPAGASCRRADATVDADIALDVRDLGATYLGGVKFASLAEAGRVEERTAGALARADAMLNTTPLPFCRTGF
jgi:predicted acetyltransferase